MSDTKLDGEISIEVVRLQTQVWERGTTCAIQMAALEIVKLRRDMDEMKELVNEAADCLEGAKIYSGLITAIRGVPAKHKDAQ